ncbi:hypothetical protein N7491_009986 [Penicillium cf. griseofulvum]|uniref:Uncharacterized protein n=1 Tax=Penicillium cf. griseofulvum TaxID=2972120 RepID=A0A9W9MZ06_9EURO|nr:hypothetical protein N7472_000318 [Penicillium cf. griseofulvum]KAJ5421541.1 hypothetical protein N7491_009986 [Penicillium cf. griseofulvum]KAJ5424776.1 hypothetical protein N7445_010749 [Penicillium cf. griseofulvum]
MASNHSSHKPDRNCPNDTKEVKHESRHLTALQTLPAVAIDAAEPDTAATPTAEPATKRKSDSIDNITAKGRTGDTTVNHTGDNTSDNIVTVTNTGATPITISSTVNITVSSIRKETQPSASGIDRSSSTTGYHQCDCIVPRTMNDHNMPNNPEPAPTQAWIDRIEQVVGMNFERKTKQMLEDI